MAYRKSRRDEIIDALICLTERDKQFNNIKRVRKEMDCLKAESILQPTGKLLPAARETIFSAHHKVAVEVLATEMIP
jgi:hypothetical protein